MRKHNYVVGFNGDGQVGYGKENTWAELLTFKEAQKAVKKLLKPNYARCKRIIYKLVSVETID